MKVRDWMSPKPHTLGPDATLGDAVGVMARHQIRHIPIVDEGRVVGIISDRDVKMALGPDAVHLELAEIDPRQANGQLAWFMTDGAVTVHADASLAEAGALLVERRIGALPVMEGKHLVGVLSVVDVLRAALPLLRAH